MWFVYIVACKDETLYTGICLNLKKRISDHNSGAYKNAFTKSRLPVKLVFWQKLDNRFSAAKREKEIKLIHSLDNLNHTFNKLV